MSASMYNNPYTYKPPPPKINYPPMFSGLMNCFNFKYILDSKYLALAALLQAVATLVVLITIINPFWFKLMLSPKDATFGSEPEKRELTINAGLFYIDEAQFDNAGFLNKYTGRDVVPKLLIFAEVFSVIGTCMLISCLCGTIILVFRRFGSLTAAIMLAFFSSIAGIFQILVFAFSLILQQLSNCEPSDKSCDYTENLVWRMIPIYTQFYRIEPHITPYVELNWAIFISIFGALLTCAGAVLLWIEAYLLYGSVTKVRYHQLHQARDPHEKDINVADSRQQFVYQAPVQYGDYSYGMQPVVASTGPYGGDVFLPASAPSYSRPGVGFSSRGFSDSDSEPQGRPPYTDDVRRGPPSETSSFSAGPNISREINL